MRIIRAATEPEVIASFLRGEVDSPRWREGLLAFLREDGADHEVLTAADVDDAAQNAYRAELLERHRAWLRRDGLFRGFPERVDWTLAALTPDEVLAIRYINWDWWLEISAGTRDATVAAERIHRNAVAGVTAEEHEPIAAALAASEPAAKLIAVSRPERERLSLLEGHVRLTAYALHPEYLPPELELFVGTAPDMDRWSEF